VSVVDREKIRVAVVDDEPLARGNLRVLLGRDPEVELVSECGSGAEALREIRNKRPELVFLDVQMPECDGFDVLEQLGADLPAALVFVTAYDQYALQAFEAGALDYLLKPYNNARFERALQRAKERIGQGKERGRKVEWLAIKNAGEVLFLKIAEIDWIEAADYYVCLHVGARNHLLRRSMADVEADLDVGFCRVHRDCESAARAAVGEWRGWRSGCGVDHGSEIECQPEISQGVAGEVNGSSKIEKRNWKIGKRTRGRAGPRRVSHLQGLHVLELVPSAGALG
jgi:two-component system LytT family response regulator